MTKQGEVRDWNKDKEEINQFMDGWFPGGASNTKSAVLAFFYFAKEALPYYHQQYASAEAREKKLREAIEHELIYASVRDNYGRAKKLKTLLVSLYPKEEEAK